MIMRADIMNDNLRIAIETHRSQKADDRCIEDDDRLYAALGDGIKCDRHVGSKEAMLKNCARFIERRCESGRWPSYSELETINSTLLREIKEWRKKYGHFKCTEDPCPICTACAETDEIL